MLFPTDKHRESRQDSTKNQSMREVNGAMYLCDHISTSSLKLKSHPQSRHRHQATFPNVPSTDKSEDSHAGHGCGFSHNSNTVSSLVISSSLSLFPRSLPCHYAPPNAGR
jgi:hypothetical protein